MLLRRRLNLEEKERGIATLLKYIEIGNVTDMKHKIIPQITRYKNGIEDYKADIMEIENEINMK